MVLSVSARYSAARHWARRGMRGWGGSVRGRVFLIRAAISRRLGNGGLQDDMAACLLVLQLLHVGGRITAASSIVRAASSCRSRYAGTVLGLRSRDAAGRLAGQGIDLIEPCLQLGDQSEPVVRI